jgi:serine/threonine protein kinase
MSELPTIAEFEIVRRLGAGGMAEVFVAKKRGAEGTYKVVVVKRILPSFGNSRRFRSMFIDEAMLATRLNHPNVVQVYEFSDRGEEGHILAMELVEGCDLGQLMTAARASGRPIDPYLAAWIIAEAAKGLHYAHEKRDDGGSPLEIVHRDVSPQNVLLSFDGAVKIADFGIASARFVSEEEGTLKGKYGYMSPEQARGERVDRRSDLYALGVILWEAIVGAPLHGGLGGEALLDVVRSGIVDAPSQHVRDLPEDLEAIVMKLLSPEPSDRFATGRELVQAVGRALLAQQVLVDSTTLETCIEQLVGRSLVSAEMRASAIPLTAADVPQARMSSMTPPEDRGASSMPPAPREVRHVAVVTLRLLPKAPLDASRRGALIRALERWRATLTDMAYKRGTRWVWLNELSARATVGLSSRPARAAVDAAGLALDTHEALSAIVDDLPVPLGASISIVRGIASGVPRRRRQPRQAHDPRSCAELLADALGNVTPMDSTWVAGGVYRLVRRDFRWGDGPTIELVDAENHRIPTQLRLYSLERPLTREERLAELALAPSDLVGRDAEKADLFAAFHRATSATRGSERSLPPPSLLPGPPSGGSASPATPRGGRGEIVTRAVLGEMGIGKTALVAAFLSELPEETRVVRVECSPVKSELPLATIGDLLREAAGIAQDHAPDAAVAIFEELMGATGRGPHASRLARSLAELATGRAREGAADEDAAHYRRDLVVVGVRHLLGSMALAGPLVLVVDGPAMGGHARASS